MSKGNGFRKTKSGFSYYGDLGKCVELAELKLKKLNNETTYILRRFEEERKRKERHLNSINNTKRFIELAKIELTKSESEKKE